jgi:general secretion pathway protein C
MSRRRFGLVEFCSVGLIVFFAGSALTTHVTSKLLLDVSDVDASETAEPDEQLDEEDEAEAKAAAALAQQDARALASMADKQTHKDRAASTIVDNNVFCPTCIPAEAQPVLASAGGSVIVPGEIASTLPLQLLATMESDDPAWSMATIRDVETNALGPYTANEQLRPGVTILAVERGRVVLLNHGQREFIMLGAQPPPPAPSKPKPTEAEAPASKPGKSVAIEGAEQAISCSSDNACTVERKFVDELLQNPAQLMTQARMYPVTKDGETAGFRVSGVKSGSLATLLGLKNGDVVSEINGSKLGSIDDAMAMYQKLRRANHLSVTVERGGAVITKEISIK